MMCGLPLQMNELQTLHLNEANDEFNKSYLKTLSELELLKLSWVGNKYIYLGTTGT